MVVPIWLKAVVPVALIGGGAAAYVAAPTSASDTPAAWVDSPTDGANLAAGSITVLAHATADDAPGGLVLEVDGEDEETDADLEVRGNLSFAAFTWEADPGTHTLVVHAVGTNDHASVGHVVNVVDPDAVNVPTTTTTSTTTPSSTTSSSSTSSTSSTTTSSSTTSTTSTTRPTATTNTTKPPPAGPTVTKPFLDPSTIDDTQGCNNGFTSHVDVQTTNTTSVTFRLTINGQTQTRVASQKGSTFFIDVSGDVIGGSSAGPYSVSIVAVAKGPGGTATSAASVLQVVHCKP